MEKTGGAQGYECCVRTSGLHIKEAIKGFQQQGGRRQRPSPKGARMARRGPT